MSIYRSKIIASLCLLLALCTVLLQPDLADAAGKPPRQFVFGPVLVPQENNALFMFLNTGTLPTPPATAVFLNTLTGEVLETKTLNSTPPGGGNAAFVFGPDRYVTLVVTFDRPAAGQAIPTPFPGTLQVGPIGGPKEVVYPAR